LGSTPIDAILAAGIDAEIPGFAVRLQGGTEFEAIEPDAALAHGCVLRTAEPAPAETQADPVDQLVALLDGTLNRLEAGVAEAEAAPEVFESATQTIYGLVEDGGDGSTSIRWFRDKAVADMLMDDSSENWDAAFGTNDGPEILVFPAGLNLEACGFSFSDHAHPLPI